MGLSFLVGTRFGVGKNGKKEHHRFGGPMGTTQFGGELHEAGREAQARDRHGGPNLPGAGGLGQGHLCCKKEGR